MCRVYHVLLTGLLMWAGVTLLAEDPETLAIGQEAPPFFLEGTDGIFYNLDSFESAAVLTIIFTANHCPTAQAYEERIQELSSSYDAGEMQLVAISSNYPPAVCLEELGYSDLGDSYEEMKIRASEKAFTFPYLYDGEEQAAALAYGAIATPHVFIFDRERKLRYSGRIDDMEDPYKKPGQPDAQNAIDALLEGKPVPVETTRAFGCSMKWKSKVSWSATLDQRWKEKPVDLQGIDLGGVRELLENHSDKYRLINVWATWCGPCIIEFPEFVNIQRMYGQRNFEMVSISVDKPLVEENVKSFLSEHHAAFSNYIFLGEVQGEFLDAIDPVRQVVLPHTMLVAPGGRVVYRHNGLINPLEVKQAIINELGRYFSDDS